MSLKNTPHAWGAVSQFLHWLTLALILALAIIGLTMTELPRTPKYFWVYTVHKSLGVSVLALLPVRLGWRLWAGAPRPVAGTPRWQQIIASLTHWLLYALLIAVPLSGWLYDSASSLRPVMEISDIAINPNSTTPPPSANPRQIGSSQRCSRVCGAGISAVGRSDMAQGCRKRRAASTNACPSSPRCAASCTHSSATSWDACCQRAYSSGSTAMMRSGSTAALA